MNGADAGAPQDWEGDLSTDHPNRCRLRDKLLHADIFNDDGSHRAVWRCHKRAGHDGPCSSHNDCGVMNGGVVCGKLPGHAGPHAWATEIVPAAAPDAGAPQERADSTPFLRARLHWYRDGCPDLEDVAQYFASGECARDAANDLELALTDIETLRAHRAVAEEKGARMQAAVTATEEGHSVLAHKYNDRAACPACNDALQLAPAAHQERTEPHELAEIRAFYDEHAPLDSHEHKTLIQRVRDEWHDFMAVVDHCSKVYDHFSRGRISKPMTLPREVITLADDFASEDIEEAIKEAREEWEGDVAVPARAHHEENEGNDTSGPRVDVERLCHRQELPRKPRTGCP